ncbi:MAG: hypothetical protein AB3N07_12850 [Ruegeria sp.]
MRDLIVFGNGLGRSLDQDYFLLDRGLQEAWEDDEILDATGRELIARCISKDELLEGNEDTEWPTGENQLGELQHVVSACDVILNFERDGGDGWLTEHGKSFPGAIRSFIHRTACYYHFFEDSLPKQFVASLTDHILKSRSHIATLNYDDLLYREFIGTKVFSGFNCMIDGFSGAFSENNLERMRPARQCYYLHLHGSPLFVTKSNGKIIKKSLSSIFHIAGHQSVHLVLTHIKFKPSIIEASPVLSAYWSKLKEAVSEVDRITILGYGGGDTHLNREIRNSKKPVRIVERQTTKPIKKSKSQWTELLGSKPEIIRVPSILEFTDW